MAENTEEKKELTPREQLPLVTERINNINVTKETCLKFLEEGAIKIVSATPAKEGEDPATIDVTGEIVATVLSPIIRVLDKKKEDFISYKEKLLLDIEKELTDTAEKAN